MTGRAILAVTALLAAWLAAATPLPAPAPAVTVRAVVEQPTPVTGPTHVVPWNVVPGLTRDDFEILVDGQPVAVDSFSASDTPLALVVLVDVSASIELHISRFLEPLQEFLVPALKPGDVVAFGRFGGIGLYIDDRFNAIPRSMLTAARAALTRPKPGADVAGRLRQDPWLERPGLNGAFGLGGSPAWDAVHAGVERLRRQAGRRAIILVTDGRSTANVHSVNEAILHALSNDVAVSVVNESEDVAIRQSETEVARVRPSVYLQPMAESTGGAYAHLLARGEQTPARGDPAAIQRWLGLMLARVAQDCHASYTLTFTSPATDGTVHRLQVRTKRPGLKVRARQAYLAPSAVP